MVLPSIEERLKHRVESMKAELAGDTGRLSYCALIYGSNPSLSLIANALAMANSLRMSSFPLLLLTTSDVPAYLLEFFRGSGLFYEVREVQYLLADQGLFKKDWFREVFTKLHIFNLTDFDKVLFLDLDIVVRDVAAMDELLRSSIAFGAMENSKGRRAGSMWLSHGEFMGEHCGLINAGVMLVTPDAELFELMVADFTQPSPDHVPGMTPEQFYLARVFGKNIQHIHQRFNFEIQLHGGVPVTKFWQAADFSDIICFHFSGGNPLARIQDVDPDWGCQTEKWMIRYRWLNEFDETVKTTANTRAKKAFGLWALNFSTACKTVSEKCTIPVELESLISSGAPSPPCVFQANNIRVFVEPLSFKIDIQNSPPRPARRPPPPPQTTQTTIVNS